MTLSGSSYQPLLGSEMSTSQAHEAHLLMPRWMAMPFSMFLGKVLSRDSPAGGLWLVEICLVHVSDLVLDPKSDMAKTHFK